ncbi:MAG: tetratricopeptide repeat protein [Myxococcota bacterium]
MNVGTTTLSLFFLTACGPARWVKEGDEHLSNNRPDAAASMYQKALDKDPGYSEALRGIAAAHIERENPVRAIIPAQRATKAGDMAARRYLAEALITTGRSAEAIKTLTKGREAHPDNPAYRRLLVEALNAAGEHEKAADTADELLIDINTVDARLLHAWVNVRANRMDAAVTLATDATTLAPEDGEAQALCAAIFWEANRKDDFEKTHKRAKAFLPASPADFQRSASWRQKEGDPEGAIRTLAAARAAYPGNGPVARDLGLLYFSQKAWPEAIRHLDGALQLPPFAGEKTVSGVQTMTTGDTLVSNQRRTDTIEVANRLGDAYTKVKRHSKAAQAWQLAINQTLQPTAQDVLAVAKAWEKAGNVNAMGQLAQQAASIEPSNAEAHFLLAKAFDGAGNLEWAIRHSRKSWELNPESAEVALFLGGLYESRGEKRTARELYRDAVRRHPSNAIIYAAFERVGGNKRR